MNAYARLFNFVEVNSTFYRLPRPETAERWRREVGEEFLFSVKAPRTITHENCYRGVEDVTEEFLEVVRALKAFFVLFQSPKSFRFSEENLKAVTDYINSLPDRYTYGVEFRGWAQEEVRKLAEKVNVVHVVDPFASSPVTEGVYYFRLHGSPPGPRMYRYRYTEKDLLWLMEKVLELGGNVYVVFNNVWMYEDAKRFREMLITRRSSGSPP